MSVDMSGGDRARITAEGLRVVRDRVVWESRRSCRVAECHGSAVVSLAPAARMATVGARELPELVEETGGRRVRVVVVGADRRFASAPMITIITHGARCSAENVI